jgi:ABC-2 type transport system permease protein
MSRATELRELTRVRVLSMLREPEAVFWVFVFPLVLAAVLGFAFRSGKVEPSRVAVAPATEAGALVAALEAGEDIVVLTYDTREEALTQLRKAAVDGLVSPGAEGAGGEAGAPVVRFDSARAEAETARLRIERALARAAGAPEPDIELEPVTEMGSRYVDFLFPGLIGMNLMGTGIWGIGFAIADVRRRKFLKRLLVTPMRRSSFLLSFMLSRMFFLVAELALLTTFGAWALGVPFRGDVLSYAAAALLGAIVFAGLGILIASRVRTIEGASGLMNVVMLPMWLASGVFFSYERFPEFTHAALRLLPLTALNDALRGIMLDGESILAHGPEVAVMVVWGVLSFAIALWIFRWE